MVVKAPGLSAASLFAGTQAVVHGAPGGRLVATLPAAEVAPFLARTNGRAGVAYATASPEVHAATTTNDPCASGCASNGDIVRGDVEAGGLPCGNPDALSPCPVLSGSYSQYYLNQTAVPQAWSATTGSRSILVAVLDTGVDNATGSDLSDVIAGPTLCGDETDCLPSVDDVGHGSHVSGIIGADTNNAKGVAGIGWHVRTEMFKVLNGQGEGSEADVDSGIYDAVAAGARVINMSLTGGICASTEGQQQQCPVDPDEVAAVAYAISHGVVVVAAAGNDGSNVPEFPASLPGVLSVAATDTTGSVAGFSEFGDAANIAAPGVDILSTFNTGKYALMSGTSMSSPMVAAAAALVLSTNPSLTPLQVDAVLEQTASAIPGAPINGGQLNVAAAVAAAKVAPRAVNGYQLSSADGSVSTFGSALNYGSVVGALNSPVVGIAVTPGGTGYRTDASDGGVFSFGQAAFYGSEGGQHLNEPIVGMASTADGRGYWLVASDGGIFSFGDAAFYGSEGGQHLNEPIVGMASTADGRGYWLVASDGGLFSFGDAAFYGSTGSIDLNKPIVGMASTADGRGYWLVASDGGVFSFGDAAFYGSTGSIELNRPIVAVVPSPVEGGYWLVASDGGVFAFGAARYFGSTGGASSASPVVGAGSGG